MANNSNKKRIQQFAALITIPFVLVVPPIIGWYIGKKLDKWMDSSPYMMYLFLGIGVLAGIWECVRIIKEFGNEP